MLINRLLHGSPGHPAHPPLTDATIGMFVLAAGLSVLGKLDVAPDKLGPAAWLAVIGGTFGLRFFDNRLTLGTRVTHYAARLTVPTGSTILPSKEHTLVDLFASYEHNAWLRGDLVLANIGDVRYNRYYDLNSSPGFQARGSLTVKFATR